MADAPAVSRKPTPVTWYRSPLDRDEMKRFLERSDVRALAQTLPHLALIALTGTATCLAILQPAWLFGAWNPWWLLAVIPLLLVHGFLCSFAINAVHELGHGTVFKTKWLNRLFEGVFAFIGWIHHEQFTVSHTRHHRYTLHYPDDQEEVLPKKWDRRNAIKWGGVFDWRILKNYVNNFRHQWRVVRLVLKEHGMRCCFRLISPNCDARCAAGQSCCWWVMPRCSSARWRSVGGQFRCWSQ